MISIITCVNDEEKYSRLVESTKKHLFYELLDFVPIFGAKSMAAGYNEGIQKAKLAIKVYVHQDVEILDDGFFGKIVGIFADTYVGLIGFAGVKQMPKSGVFWEGADRVGRVTENRGGGNVELNFRNPTEPYEEVEMVDGLCIATQYDIPWDERFTGFHMYDASQCRQSLNAGYKVVIPHQETPWLLHNIGAKPFDGNAYLKEVAKYKRLYNV